MNALRAQARRVAAPAVIVAALAGGATGISHAAVATTEACPKGKASVVVGRKAHCAAAKRALPAPTGATTGGSFVVVSVLQGKFAKLGLTAFRQPKQLKGHRDPFAGPTSTLAPLIEPMARAAIARVTGTGVVRHSIRARLCCDLPADKNWTGPVDGNPTQSADGWTVTGTSTLVANADGVVGTTTVTAYVPKDEHSDNGIDRSRGTVSIDVKIEKPGGGSTTSGFDFPLVMTDLAAAVGFCPSATGHLSSKVSDHLGLHTSERGMTTGVDYVNKSQSFTANGTLDAIVGPDARLQTIKFTMDYTDETAQASSLLHGLIHNTWTTTVTAHATGTIDGASGAVSLSSLVLDGKGRALGETNAAATAVVREVLRSTSGLYAQTVSQYVSRGYKQLKEAEKEWRVPNACASMAFTPASGAKVAAGTTLPVAGKIVSKLDGGESEARWAAPAISRGSLGGAWPGSSAPGTPLRFGAKGAAPDASGVTFDLIGTATSRAGVAKGQWTGTDERIAFFDVNVHFKMDFTSAKCSFVVYDATIVGSVNERDPASPGAARGTGTYSAEVRSEDSVGCGHLTDSPSGKAFVGGGYSTDRSLLVVGWIAQEPFLLPISDIGETVPPKNGTTVITLTQPQGAGTVTTTITITITNLHDG